MKTFTILCCLFAGMFFPAFADDTHDQVKKYYCDVDHSDSVPQVEEDTFENDALR